MTFGHGCAYHTASCAALVQIGQTRGTTESSTYPDSVTKTSLVRQFEIFSMVSWAVAYTWGHTPYDIRICPHSLQTAKPHYVECSARSLRNSRPVDNAYPKLTVAQQHLHTILGVESSR